MRYSLLSILFIFSSILPVGSTDQSNDDTNRVQDNYANSIKLTKKRAHQLMHRHHLPGFSIVLVDDQQIIYREVLGFSDMEKKTPTSTGTVFKLWSVAKAFTATEIFREVEEGLVDLDVPITEYLPEFTIKSDFKDGKPITVRNILAHRSGLPRNECITIPSEIPGMLDRFEASISDCYLAYPVGYRYKYSNLGYDILGRVIEQNRNESFTDYMNGYFLKSLGMVNSSFSSGNLTNHKELAKGYEFYKGKYYPMDQSYDINSIPSGNLYATIEDLSIFLKAVFSNQIFQEGGTGFNMFEDCYSKRSDPETMGLGWKTSLTDSGELMAWHDGGPDDGTGALIAFLPGRKLGLAVVSNSTGFGGNVSVPLAKEIFHSMVEEKLKIGFNPPGKPVRIELNKPEAQGYEGKYVAFNRIMDVAAKNRKLKGKISGIGLDLIPVGRSEFKITHWTEKTGLTKILRPPIDFSKVRIWFAPDSIQGSLFMIINLDNISFEVCPRYPQMDRIPEEYEMLVGEYRMAERLPGNKAGKISGSLFRIYIDDNVLTMSDPFGPIIPGDDHSIIISSGPFAGETMEWNIKQGEIIHQNAVFSKI